MNDSAFATRDAIKESIGDTFEVRRKWVQRLPRIQKATKSRPVATVGTDREILEDHVTGGFRDRNAIPTRKTRTNPRRVVTRRLWPGSLRDSRHFFVETDAALPSPFRRHAGRGERLLIRRGRGRSRKLALRWVLPRTQRVRPIWDFDRVLKDTAPAAFLRALPGRLERALATARPPR